jgi:hypothetical protein
MKTLSKRLLSILFTAIFSLALSTSAFAYNVNPNIVYSSDGQSSIEYLPEENAYHIKNIAPEELLAAFDASADLTLVESDNATAIASLSTSRNATFNRQYQVTVNVTGLFNEQVPIIYTVYMKMSQMLVNGTLYDYFVEVFLGPTPSLGNNSYRFSDGASDPNAEIRANGSTLTIAQIVQLEITTTESVDVGATIGWFSVGASVGSEFIFRNTPQTYARTIVLPLYNVIY